MAEKDLVEVVIGNLKCRDSLRGSRPYVEEKLVTVAKLDEEAGRRLARTCRGHAGSTRDDPHLIRAQVLAIREIGIPRPRLYR